MSLRAARVLASRIWGLRRLPPRVALFQLRALVLASRLGDAFALQAASRPSDVHELLALADGRRSLVELGTATGWTTASLALADGARRVTSFDPVDVPNRGRYLALAGEGAADRLALVRARGVDGGATWSGERVDFLFIDSTHERDDTIAEFSAWHPHLAPGALVVFHDYGNPAFPGVAEAVSALGLSGDVRGGAFVWRAGP